MTREKKTEEGRMKGACVEGLLEEQRDKEGIGEICRVRVQLKIYECN